MKSVNDFVNTDLFGKKHGTLQDNMQNYKKVNENLETLKQKQKKYDELINSKKKEDSSDLTFKEKYVIYTMIKNVILRGKEDAYFGMNLYSLREKFESLYDDLHEYLSIKRGIETLQKRLRDIITEDITFDCFNDEHYNEHCLEGHSFVVDGKELKCVYCGATTKDYPLTEEEFEFLVLCAKKRNMLLEEFTKEDWPLLQVVIEKQDYRRSLRPEIDILADDYLDKVEEQFYDDEHEFRELRITLARAHMLDDKIYDGKKIKVKNPKYLSETQKQELLEKLEKEIEEIQEIDSRFKPLLTEQCKTAKYEILILSGEHIPTMLKEATNENDKIALTKAYYNLSNMDFRINSGYFDPSHRDNDAIFYDCYTANPDINSRILEMKLRRK